MATFTDTINSTSYLEVTYAVSCPPGSTAHADITQVRYVSTRSGGCQYGWKVEVVVRSGDTTVRKTVTFPSGTSSKDFSIAFTGPTITRTHSAQTTTLSIQATFYKYDGGVYNQTPTYSNKTGSVSPSIDARTSYSVTYNVNDGSSISGTPQTKWYDEPLTLLSSGNTLSGYNFAGWNTNSSGTGTSYALGATYTGNAALSLHSKWTRTVNYDASPGTNAPAAQTALKSTALTLTTAKPSSTAYQFKGWATSPSGATATYQPGGTYAANNPNITLYALWGVMVTDISAERCDSEGILDDEGTYMKLTLSWNGAPNASAKPTVALSISPAPSGAVTNPTLPSKTGTASFVIAGPFDVNVSYIVTVTLTDSVGSYVAKATLASAFFTMDVLGDSYYYQLTTDTSVVSEKTYYQLSNGEYVPVSSPSASALSSYYEASGPRPGHGVAFGAPCVGEGFRVNMGLYLIVDELASSGIDYDLVTAITRLGYMSDVIV